MFDCRAYFKLIRRSVFGRAAILFMLLSASLLTVGQGTGGVNAGQDATRNKIPFINNAFENASPFNWEIDSNGNIAISLVYDHERSSLNRANQHWHFQVQGIAGS